MTQTTVINKINDLKYKGFKEAYLRQIEDVNYHSLTFEDRLYNLLDSEAIFLQNKRIVMNTRLSRIKDKEAMVEELDYSSTRNLNKAQILSFITMDFLRAKQNIIITGKTGTGKSYLAQSLGNRAIIDGFTVYYIRTATLLEDIKEVVVEQLSVNADEVKEDAKFVEDLGADSLDVVELVMALEEKFDIEIPDDEAEKIQTVKDVVDYIESK